MKLPFAITALGVAGLLAACSPPAPPRPATREVRTLAIAGETRTYIVRLRPPTDITIPLDPPLVMLLHGANDSAAYAEEAYHFAELADREHFVLVLPEGTGDRRAWHGFDPEPNKDLYFLRAVLAAVTKEFRVDPRRIYVAGHSSGAIMAYRFAAEEAGRIAAVGVVAGTVGRHNPDNTLSLLPAPKGPVSVIAFHGKLDDNIPYDAPINPGPYDFYTLPVTSAVSFWTKADGCDPKAAYETLADGKVERTSYRNPATGYEVALYTLQEGNHMWPGGKVMPGKSSKPPQDLSATEVMWAFFKAHPRPEGRATPFPPPTSRP